MAFASVKDDALLELAGEPCGELPWSLSFWSDCRRGLPSARGASSIRILLSFAESSARMDSVVQISGSGIGDLSCTDVGGLAATA